MTNTKTTIYGITIPEPMPALRANFAAYPAGPFRLHALKLEAAMAHMKKYMVCDRFNDIEEFHEAAEDADRAVRLAEVQSGKFDSALTGGFVILRALSGIEQMRYLPSACGSWRMPALAAEPSVFYPPDHYPRPTVREITFLFEGRYKDGMQVYQEQECSAKGDIQRLAAENLKLKQIMKDAGISLIQKAN